jgi:protein TonB
MRVKEVLIWGAAIALSLLLHLLLFVDSGSVAGADKPIAPSTTRVSFRSVAAPLTSPQDEPQEEKLTKPEEEVIEAPAPPPKPKPKKEAKRIEKVRQVEPPKPTRQPEPVTPPVPSTEIAQKQAVQTEAAAGSIDDPALRQKAKHEYLRHLMSHIESHKFYPRAARRRGLQAVVRISFELLADGQIKNLRVTEGHKLLRSAAEEAMARALPMPRPPDELETPLAINFSMAYQLL